MTSVDLFNTVPKTPLLPFIFENGEINVKELMGFLHLEKADIAAISGISIESVRFDDRMPLEVRKRFIELANLCELVAEYYGSERIKIETWFTVENPMLENQSPCDLIKVGRHKEIVQHIYKLRISQKTP